MTTYRDAGVDVTAGDAASRSAYAHAASTFPIRKDMIGAPVFDDGGFAGLLDMGEYYLVQTSDGTGTKMDLAAAMQDFRTLGFDLLAMVADDAVCIGAEVLSVSNCLDVPSIDPVMIDALLSGLASACREQCIVIPAGEIAEVPGAVSRGVWSATAIGIVAKDRVIDGSAVQSGSAILSLRSAVARSNGFSLIRKILTDHHGDTWWEKQWNDDITWGNAFLTPSIVYHRAILALTGRYGQERRIPVQGIAHVTGGGIPSKLRRVLKRTGTGAHLTDLWPPHQAIADIAALGKVPAEEAYRTWNMGNGMLVIVPQEYAEESVRILADEGIEAQQAGTVTDDPTITITHASGDLRCTA